MVFRESKLNPSNFADTVKNQNLISHRDRDLNNDQVNKRTDNKTTNLDLPKFHSTGDIFSQGSGAVAGAQSPIAAVRNSSKS